LTHLYAIRLPAAEWLEISLSALLQQMNHLYLHALKIPSRFFILRAAFIIHPRKVLVSGKNKFLGLLLQVACQLLQCAELQLSFRPRLVIS
jgi:hypothetical protein